jgi:hypothetical protein
MDITKKVLVSRVKTKGLPKPAEKQLNQIVLH